MDKDKGPISWLKRQFSRGDHSTKKSQKYSYLVIVLILGAAIMILSNFLQEANQDSATPVASIGKSSEQKEMETFGQKDSSDQNTITDYEEQYASHLKEALERIAGVSDVTVVVNVDSTEKKVLEKNRVRKSQKTDEKDREGGERTVEDHSEDEQVVIIRNGEKEVPIVLETKKPEIRGVLVVAKGADNIQVKKWIIESVTKLLDVPSHRVSVMPKK